jgi:hypothetical protein
VSGGGMWLVGCGLWRGVLWSWCLGVWLGGASVVLWNWVRRLSGVCSGIGGGWGGVLVSGVLVGLVVCGRVCLLVASVRVSGVSWVSWVAGVVVLWSAVLLMRETCGELVLGSSGCCTVWSSGVVAWMSVLWMLWSWCVGRWVVRR